MKIIRNNLTEYVESVIKVEKDSLWSFEGGFTPITEISVKNDVFPRWGSIQFKKGIPVDSDGVSSDEINTLKL
jgi:hypothetical protein